MTNDRESVVALYERVKYDLKMDFISWLFLSALFSSAIALLMVITSPGDLSGVCFFSVYVGVVLASAPVGIKVILGFGVRVLKCFEVIGVLILIAIFVALFALSLQNGPLIVIIKFIIGLRDTRKLKKLLG